MAKAFVGSNPTPRTRYGENLVGFKRVMLNRLSVAFRLSEDFSSVVVFACHVLKARIC